MHGCVPKGELEFEHNFVIVIYNIFSISATGILFKKKIAFFTKGVTGMNYY